MIGSGSGSGSGSGFGLAGASHAAPGSQAALSQSASELTKLRSSVDAIGDAGDADQFLTAQLVAFRGSAPPRDQDLPTLTASITAEIEKISVLVRGNTRVRTTLTRELTFLDTLEPKSAAKRKLNAEHGNLAALIPPNGKLGACLDLYFQGEPAAPAQLAWMHAATATIVRADVAVGDLNLEHVADALKALREFDKALWALMRSVPNADADGGPDRYSAFTQARREAVGGGVVDFTTRLNQAVTFLISRCDADDEGIQTLISILNDPNVPGTGTSDQVGDIKYTAITKLKSHIPTLSAGDVVRLYGALRLNQGTIRAALADRLTDLGKAAVKVAAAAGGGLAGVRGAYVRHFRELELVKPDLGDDADVLRQVTAKLAEPDLTMADIMTYYAEVTHDLGGLPPNALVLIEAKLDTLAAPPDRLDVEGFVQLVKHLRAFRTALTGGDGTATDRMTPFLPYDMNLEAMDTPADLMEAHGALGDLGGADEVKAVLTSRLSALAGAVNPNDADTYSAFVNGFHAAYAAIAPGEFEGLCRAKLPADLDAGQIQAVYAGIDGDEPKAVVRPSLIRRVLVSLDAQATLPNIVQTCVPVLEALGLDRPEAFSQLKANGILHSRLSDNPAGLAAQFGQLEDDKAALRDLFLSVLTDQAQVLPANMDNDALQAHIKSFLEASRTISGDEWDRDPVLTALMTTIAGNLTPEACVGLYTHLVRADGGMAKTITNALWAPLANRVWEQVINGAAADFAGSVNRLRGQLTALTYGAGDLARAMRVKNIANFLPADLTTGDIKTIYTRLTEDADKAAVRDALVIQRVALYNALSAAQTAQLFIDDVEQLAADLGELGVQAIPTACADINVASKLPPETVEMTPADVDGIVAALAPLGYPAHASVAPRLIKAIESYLGRGRADVDASLTSLRRALGQSEDAAKAIIISKLPVADRLAAITTLGATPELVALIVSGVPPATTAEFKMRIELFESVLGKLKDSYPLKGQCQSSLLTTVNRFLSNAANLDDEALLDLLPRMGKLLGDKVAEIKVPNIPLTIVSGSDQSSLTSTQIRVLDAFSSISGSGFRPVLVREFRIASLELSGRVRSLGGGHDVFGYAPDSAGNVVQNREFVQGVYDYNTHAVTAFLEMASGLAHIEATEVQKVLLAELKHLVTKMTQCKPGRVFTGAQLTTLMSIMETSARAIPAAAATAAPTAEQATAIRRDFLETMDLLGNKALNEAPKQDLPELRSRYSEIMAAALAQGGAVEAAAEAASESHADASDSSGSTKSPTKGFLNLSSIPKKDTARLVSIYRGQFSGAVTASEKFRPIVALADRLKAAVNSKDNAQHKAVIDLLIPMIDAAFKDNDFDTALQLVPFLRPLMDLKVTHKGNNASIAAVYGTRIATLLGSCASQPNAALKAEVVKAATDLALLTKDYPSKSWERARRVLTLGLAHPLKLRGASAGTTCGELSVMLLAKLAKDKSSVVKEAAKDGLFQLYSSHPAMMGLGEAYGNNMRHMVKIGMKDAGLVSSPSSFMPNGAIRVNTTANEGKRDILEGVRGLMTQPSDSDLVGRFGNQLSALQSQSLDLRPRAVAMMLDEVTKRVMTDDNREGKDVFVLLEFVGRIASQGVTYASRERLMALQTLRVLYPLMDKEVQVDIKAIFKEIMQGKVTATDATATDAVEFAQLREQAAAALAWIGVPVKERVEGSKSGSSGGVVAESSILPSSSLGGEHIAIAGDSSNPRESEETTKSVSGLHKQITAGDEGGLILTAIEKAVNTQLNSREEPDVASISQHLDLLAFWMSSYPELATSNDVRDFLLRVSTSGRALVQFKVVPLLGQFAALCTDYRRETPLIHDRFPSGNVVVKRLQVLATTGGDQSVKDAATATFLKLLAGPAEANDAMRSVLKKQFPGTKAERNEETLAGIRAVVHAFRTDVTSTFQGMTPRQKLVAIDEVVLSYHKDHSSKAAVVKALGDFLPSSLSDADGASLPAARALMNLYPFLTDDQKSVVYVSLETSMATNPEVAAFILSKGADRVRFIAAEAHQVDAASSSSSSSSRSVSQTTNELIPFLDGTLSTRKAALAALVGRFNVGNPSEESLEIFKAVQRQAPSSSSAGVFKSLSKKTDPFQGQLEALEKRILAAITNGNHTLAEQYLQVGYSDQVRLEAARRLVGFITADRAAVSGASGGGGNAEAASDVPDKADIMGILSQYQRDHLFSDLFHDLPFTAPTPDVQSRSKAGAGFRQGAASLLKGSRNVLEITAESRESADRRRGGLLASTALDETPPRLGRSATKGTGGSARSMRAALGPVSNTYSQVVSPGAPLSMRPGFDVVSDPVSLGPPSLSPSASRSSRPELEHYGAGVAGAVHPTSSFDGDATPPIEIITIHFPSGATGTNIAQLSQTNVSTVLLGSPLVFDRIVTNGDGSCALHALLGDARNSEGRWGLQNPMEARVAISKIVQKLDTEDFMPMMPLLDDVINARGALDSGIFTRILDRFPLELGADYTFQNKVGITKAIFSEIIARLTGGADQLEGQITPAELKLISILRGVNVRILSPTREGFANEMTVWRSQPDNSLDLITVVHSGGEHWERWNQR